MAVQPPPERIELIGNELALAWPDGREDFLPAPFLRTNSPSAENKGEPDLFGRISGDAAPKNPSSVSLKGFDYVGNYAARLVFSDDQSRANRPVEPADRASCRSSQVSPSEA